jgi:SAM-dependent methyltransferase
MENSAEYITTLISLHRGLKRQGPGDDNLSYQILNSLNLPVQPKIADLGCGSGSASILLAQFFHSPVIALDTCDFFLKDLENQAKILSLVHLITPVQGDMAKLSWLPNSFDLFWSEGAVYNIGFEKALHLWRPFLKQGGKAVISEISWFVQDIPDELFEYWHSIYPKIATEEQNISCAETANFKVLNTYRLSSDSWWKNYYNPLKTNIKKFNSDTNPMTPLVISEIESEIDLFREYSDFYGYTFYVLQAS